jgi:4-hydroxy-tetrahydrodipicolinate synthase
MSIPLQLIDELSHHENIVGTKDSERSEERLSESIALWQHREDFSHFLGWAGKSAHALINGSDGLVPSTGNLHPGIYAEMLRAVNESNNEKAYQMQKLSDVLGNLYQQGKLLGESLSTLKLVMKEINLCEKYVMPPLQLLSAEDEKLILNQFNEIKTSYNLTFNN